MIFVIYEIFFINPNKRQRENNLLLNAIFFLALLLLLISCGRQNEQVKWQDYEYNPVLTVGDSGSWDAGALGSMSVLKVDNTYHMYYEAWGVRSDTVWDRAEYNTLQIGHATSKDGKIWLKDKEHNPVIERGNINEWDSHGTWDPFVI